MPGLIRFLFLPVAPSVALVLALSLCCGAGVAHAAGTETRAEHPQRETGQIAGIVLDWRGQPVAEAQVELRRPRSAGRGRLAGATDEAGRFVFSRLGPGRYEIEVRERGRVLATSGAVELSDGDMRASDVVVALPVPASDYPRPLPRTSVESLLNGAPPIESFAALAGTLDSGHEVIVEDEAGRRTRGRVLGLSDDELTILVCRWWSPCRPRFLRPRPYSGARDYPRDSIAKVELVDSTLNGALIGAAVGAAAMAGLVYANREELADSNLAPVGYFFFGAVTIGPGIAVGQLIDQRKNESIYERPSPGPLVTIAPLIGPHRTGFGVRIVF